MEQTPGSLEPRPCAEPADHRRAAILWLATTGSGSSRCSNAQAIGCEQEQSRGSDAARSFRAARAHFSLDPAYGVEHQRNVIEHEPGQDLRALRGGQPALLKPDLFRPLQDP